MNSESKSFSPCHSAILFQTNVGNIYWVVFVARNVGAANCHKRFISSSNDPKTLTIKSKQKDIYYHIQASLP